MSQSRSPEGVEYRTSSYSGGDGCVAVGRREDGSVVVRHSRGAADVSPLVFSGQEWAVFVAGVKDGEFDYE